MKEPDCLFKLFCRQLMFHHGRMDPKADPKQAQSCNLNCEFASTLNLPDANTSSRSMFCWLSLRKTRNVLLLDAFTSLGASSVCLSVCLSVDVSAERNSAAVCLPENVAASVPSHKNPGSVIIKSISRTKSHYRYITMGFALLGI
jgi:hypothetical protein